MNHGISEMQQNMDGLKQEFTRAAEKRGGVGMKENPLPEKNANAQAARAPKKEQVVVAKTPNSENTAERFRQVWY